MILWIVHLIWGSYIGRMLTAGLLALGLIKGYGLKEYYTGSRDAAAHIAKLSKEEGEKNNAEVAKALKRLDGDKYFDGLRQQWCRDCK
jgi:hypothetical protein